MYMMRVMLFFVKLLRPQAFYKLSWSNWVGVSNGWGVRGSIKQFFGGFKQENPWRVLDGQSVGSWLWHFLEELETSTKVSCMLTVKRLGRACCIATKSPLGGFRTKSLSVK